MLKRVRELPSLDLLKGFEAAARNLSFTKAAAELFVTQSAVSRQIQTLEAQLGVALFRRNHRDPGSRARRHRSRHSLLHAEGGRERRRASLRRAGVPGVLQDAARGPEARFAQGLVRPGAAALRRSLPALSLAQLGGVV